MHYQYILNNINNVSYIFDLYRKYGGANYIGEEVTQLQHACQAAILAEKEFPNDLELILAAFLHDIGHLLEFTESDIKKMDSLGVLNHEILGGNLLKQYDFPQRLIKLVQSHVNTKRYLVTKNESYFENLSEASRQTLNFQGGKMTDQELVEYENDPFFKLYLKIREWDDKSKIVDYDYGTQNIDYFQNKCIDMLCSKKKSNSIAVKV